MENSANTKKQMERTAHDRIAARAQQETSHPQARLTVHPLSVHCGASFQ
jgi:hypothetical protein